MSVRVRSAVPVSVVKCETPVGQILHELGVSRQREILTVANRQLYGVNGF